MTKATPTDPPEPHDATEQATDLVEDEMGAGQDERALTRNIYEKVIAPKKPRLASIVREVEAAVRELEKPPTKE